MTELTPYRIDGRKVIAEFEATEARHAGHRGARARLLGHLDPRRRVGADAGARDPLRSSRARASRSRPSSGPRGLLLKIRTLKRDGRVLEPEIVPGKETITMPHLEIGDYIETETITTLHGDGQGGQRFEGPRWFFREEKIPYFRSEFITVSPKNRPLDIETGGTVPRPRVSESGALVIRRWRVDKSPALPEETASAPIQEFLPNVRIGWGISLKDTVARMVDAAADETPRDPRLVRVAPRTSSRRLPLTQPSAAKSLPKAPAEPGAGAEPRAERRARRRSPSPSRRRRRTPWWRWPSPRLCPGRAGVHRGEGAAHLPLGAHQREAGREPDGRRVVMGKSGNTTEAFLYLCRLAGIDARLGPGARPAVGRRPPGP